MKESKIEWTHHTFNPWRGCTKVSEGCKFCYAETLSARNPKTLGVWGPKGSRAPAAESYWKQPLAWEREARSTGQRRRVFCASLADVFEGPETMPADSWTIVEEGRARLWELIPATPNLDWLLLTKRPENVLRIGFAPPDWQLNGFPSNAWVGTSVEDQDAANKRLPELARINAWKFLSMEPLIGPVSLFDYVPPVDAPYSMRPAHGVSWVIVGGESGKDARPMSPEWVRGIRLQCEAAGIPFLFKQWGEWAPECHGDGFDSTAELSDKFVTIADGDYTGLYMAKVGKARAGRILDGQVWDGYPYFGGIR